MKRKLLTVLALAAAGVFLLTACSASGSDQTGGNSAVSGTGSENSGSSATGAGNENGGSSASGAGDENGGNPSSGTGNENIGSPSSGTGNENGGSPASGAGSGSVSEGTANAENTGKNDAAEAPDASQDVVTEDVWSGSYAGDQESVSLQLNEDGTLRFSFAQSGISGTADVDGSQAVYNGDDGYILTFSKSQGMLKIAVSHSEGYDSSDSPLNGSYVPSY